MNKRPILHVSICYENCPSAIKKELKKQLATYTQRQDRSIPDADICVDTLNYHEEKRRLDVDIFYSIKRECKYL